MAMKNEVGKEGDLLYQNLVKSELVEFLEKMVEELGKGVYSQSELPVAIVTGKDGSLDRAKVVTPHISGNKRKTLDESFYGMDYRNYELLIHTSLGWQRTGYIVRFVAHH